MGKSKNPITSLKTKKIKKKSKKKSKIALWITIAFLILGSLAFLFFYNKATKPLSVAEFRKQAPEGFPTIGIDVSHHQGKIDWDKLFNHSRYDTLIHFVYCKATEGNTLEDREWLRNRKELNNLGIPNGAYHFFISKDPPLPQATHFLNHWKKRDIDLPPVLDVEVEGLSDEDLISNMKVWLNEVEKKSGLRPIIYTSRHFYETKFQHVFLNYKFWIAAYSGKPTCIEDDRIIHWQFSESGRIPGTREKVDLNVSKLVY